MSDKKTDEDEWIDLPEPTTAPAAASDADEWVDLPAAEDAAADVPLDVEKPTQTGAAETIMRNVSQGAVPFIDETTAGIGALYQKAKALAGARGDISVKDAYKTLVDSIRNRDKLTRKEHPYLAAGSGLAGAAASSVGIGALANAGGKLGSAAQVLTPAKGAGVKEVVGKSALQGALQGYGASDSESFAGDAGNTLLGGALGGSLGWLSKATGDKMQSYANQKAVKAMDPLLKHQETLNRKDAVQELGKMLRDEKVVRFGSSVDDMLPRAEAALAGKGARIGDIRAAADEAAAAAGKPGISLDDFGAQADDLIKANKGTNLLTQAHNRKLAANLNELALRPQRSIADLQAERQAVGAQAPFNEDFASLPPSKQAMVSLYKKLAGKVDDAVGEHRPDLKPEYDKTMRQFSLFKDAEKILDKATARQARNASVGLLDRTAAAAVKGQGGGIAPGIAAALASKMFRERGNAAMAVSFGKVGELMARMPDNRFVATLREALARGGISAFASTHQKLLNEHPEYAELLEGGAP